VSIQRWICGVSLDFQPLTSNFFHLNRRTTVTLVSSSPVVVRRICSSPRT
jgi:hypothetical protein